MCDECGCSYTKPIGEVTHYFGKPMVAVIRCDDVLKNGDEIQVKGSTTDFTMKVNGIRNEQEMEIEQCPAGEICAFRTTEKARAGDKIWLFKRETTA